jgi:hypothetical protein
MATKTECRLVERWMNSLGDFATLRVDAGLNADLRASKAGTRFVLGWSDGDAAFKTEIQLVSVKTNTVGTNISFKVHPSDVCGVFLAAPFKSSWSVAWLEMTEQDEPTDGEMAREMGRAKSSWWKLLRNHEFATWYADRRGLHMVVYEDVATALETECGIKDPEELETNRTAFVTFKRIRADFYKHYSNNGE